MRPRTKTQATNSNNEPGGNCMNEPEKRRKQETGRLRGWIKTNWTERVDTASECVAVHLQANDALGTLVGPECGRCEWAGGRGRRSLSCSFFIIASLPFLSIFRLKLSTVKSRPQKKIILKYGLLRFSLCCGNNAVEKAQCSIINRI